MSLYKNTYNAIITSLASSIYNKIQSKIINTTQNVVFYSHTTAGLQEYKRSSGRGDSVTTTEKITSNYRKPTAQTISGDIKTYIKNTLGFSDSKFNQVPDGNDMLAFVFALNYFLENSLTKVAVSLTTTTIVYTPITSGYSNNFPLYNNIINSDLISKMYDKLKNVGDTTNTGRALGISGSIASSCSSSSCSSSSSSSCSSSCSSSSVFIVYFNI